jgi:hypothetical protein
MSLDQIQLQVAELGNTTMLPWWKPKLAIARFATSSSNKVCAGSLFFYSFIAMSLLLAGHGGKGMEFGDVMDCGIGGGWGSLKLHLGEEHMADGSRHDSWLRRWPLLMPLLGSVQPPLRMPFAGATSVFITISTPSGLIPTGKDSGRQWSFVHGGRLQGPDRFSLCFSKVLCAKKNMTML